MTIKEAAAILGYSKEGLRHLYDKLPDEHKVIEVHGNVRTKIVTDAAFEMLKSMATKRPASKDTPAADKDIPLTHQDTPAAEKDALLTYQDIHNESCTVCHDAQQDTPEVCQDTPVTNKDIPSETSARIADLEKTVSDLRDAALRREEDFRKERAVLCTQLEKKDAEIERLHNLLDHEQQLHAQTMARIPESKDRKSIREFLHKFLPKKE